jgi:hypothetical protein
VNKIFAERTGVTGQLNPERDVDLVRVWLRIRDAVMSGASKIPGRLLLKLNGSGGSPNGSQGGWFELLGSNYLSRPVRDQPGMSATPPPTGMTGWFDPRKNPELQLYLGQGLLRATVFVSASIRFNTPSVVVTNTLEHPTGNAIWSQGPYTHAKLLAVRMKFDVA